MKISAHALDSVRPIHNFNSHRTTVEVRLDMSDQHVTLLLQEMIDRYGKEKLVDMVMEADE